MTRCPAASARAAAGHGSVRGAGPERRVVVPTRNPDKDPVLLHRVRDDGALCSVRENVPAQTQVRTGIQGLAENAQGRRPLRAQPSARLKAEIKSSFTPTRDGSCQWHPMQ
jgi:hypothetical protein